MLAILQALALALRHGSPPFYFWRGDTQKEKRGVPKSLRVSPPVFRDERLTNSRDDLKSIRHSSLLLFMLHYYYSFVKPPLSEFDLLYPLCGDSIS